MANSIQKTLLGIFIFLECGVYAQESILVLTLSDVVNHYALHSPAAKIEHLNFRNETLEYTNYRKSFLPSVSLTLNPVNFNRSLRLLQSPENGSYSYIEDYSNSASVGLSISQKIELTGGSLNIGTDLNILDEYSRDYQSFSGSPFYINYSQNLWGGRKRMRIEKKIRETRNLISIKQYCGKLAEIQQRAAELYLATLSEKLSADLSIQNMAVNDTLLRLGKLKLENGDITAYDYKQIELQTLDAQYAYRQALKRYEETIRDLANYLMVDADSISIRIPQLDLPLSLDASTVSHHVQRNNPSVLEQQTKRLEAEQALFNARLETRFNGNVSLNYGLNQYAESLSAVYRNTNRRQSVSVGLSIPIWQWGINRNKRKIAENTYEASLLSVESSIREFEDDIKENIHTYNHSVCLWQLSEAYYRLAREQYAVAVKAFALGELSVYELTSARQKQDETMQQYYAAIKDAYSSYFRLRNLSLYDFRTEQDLEDVYININKSIINPKT